MKTFWKYTLITLLLLAGLFVLGLLFLFFVPGSSIFGVTYISYNAEYYSQSYSADSLNKLIFNSRSYAVNLVPSTSGKISVKVYTNATGFARTKSSKVAINAKSKAGQLTLDVEEPHGMLFNNKSYIELRVPTDMAADLNIVNRNATVNLSNKDMSIGNLFYSTNFGTLKLEAGAITGSLDLEIGGGNVYVGKDFALQENPVRIDVKDGLFDASLSKLGAVTITNNTRGVIKINECTSLNEKVETAGGRLELRTVGSINVQSSDTDIYINELTHGGTISLDSSSTATGKVEINSIKGVADIKTNEGSITIHSATEPLYLESGSGDIKADNILSNVTANSTYGNIDVNFSKDAPAYSTDTLSRMLIATTHNGKITATGVNNVNISIKGKGRVEMTLDDVLGENIIDGKDGNVAIRINKDSKYRLTTHSDQGDVSVNLLQLSEFGGYTTNVDTTTYVNHNEGDSVTNSLYITTMSGNLYVRDTTWG